MCFHVFVKEETSSGTVGTESKNNNVEARMHKTRIVMFSAAYCSEAAHCTEYYSCVAFSDSVGIIRNMVIYFSQILQFKG